MQTEEEEEDVARVPLRCRASVMNRNDDTVTAQ